MKLFPKLALSVSALLMATTLCLSMAFYWMQRRAIESQAEQERQAVLHNLVHISQESAVTNDDLLLVKYAGWLQKWTPALLSASVIGSSGEIIAHSQPDLIGKAAVTEEPSSTEILVLSEPVRLGNHVIGTASVEFSQKYYGDLIRVRLLELQTKVSEVAALAWAVGLLLSFAIALSWTRPVGALVHAAEAIGRGKYDVTLPATDRRKDELGFLSRAFERMARELQELDQMKEDFVSAVTHELRSPLGAIESYLHLMAEEHQAQLPTDGWPMYIERLKLNTQRLTRFVNDLLDVAALERGKISLQRQPTNLGLLTQDVVAFFGAKLAEKSLRVPTRIPEPMPLVSLDAEKIRQVLTNLLSNAIKFTPSGGSIEIAVEILKAEDGVRVSVSDTGVGIAPEDQRKIFNKFEQVKTARATVKGPKGTGLGLSISKALVELHGGTIGLSSEEGRGSTFYFIVPLEEKTAPQLVTQIR